MAESFPSVIATNILTEIAFLTSPQTRLSRDLPDEISELKTALLGIKKKLLNAEEQQSQYPKLQKSLADLSDLLYDAEDELGEFRFKVAKSRPGKSKGINFSWSSNSPDHKIKEITKKLRKLADNIKMSDVSIVSSSKMVINDTFLRTSEVIGRDDDKEKIINILKKQDENVSVLAIVGDRDIGKTTLAKLVYGDRRIDELFRLKMWVRVPADFDVPALIKETCTAATGQNQAGLIPEQIRKNLLQALAGKKFLLVLDNVLDIIFNDRWKDFKILLAEKSAKGSKIVITTRMTNDQVSEKLGPLVSCDLGGLSEEVSLSFLKLATFIDKADKKNLDLNDIRKEIVTRSGGVPLVVKILGILLYGNTKKDDWLRIMNDIWGQNQEKNSIVSALKLSYARLPSHLRRCLAYCSLFPKGYSFNSDYLIFKIKDIVHDAILKVAQNELQIVDLNPNSVKGDPQHLSFLGFGKNNKEVSFTSKKLRTVIMQSTLSEGLIVTWISKFKYLRLLCLSDLQFEKLPDSVGKLKHLRCLDISQNSSLVELSEAVCKLLSLQTLILVSCSKLQKLPSNMQSLTSLRTLILRGCDSLSSLSCNITDMKLEKLVIHSCPMLKRPEKLVIRSYPVLNVKMDQTKRNLLLHHQGTMNCQLFSERSKSSANARSFDSDSC
ncbi:putative disease resistance protein RGA3 [Pistacia vera]|uniref:putative disease resistance protein RGA3 n=1 Tax=Pistacia vera TaxID=55513 RepID=UPI001262B181|nr:putative disease resistance protein RGA3 [Pistacia vera]